MNRVVYSIFAIVMILFLLWGCAPSHPMIIAAYDGDFDRVQGLLKEGVDVNMQYGRWNETALYAAARQGHIDMVKGLLKEGADVNLLTKYGDSALTGATWQCHRDVAMLLVSEGANVNFRNQSHGYSPLMFAVECENLNMLKFLVENGADVNMRNNSGNTALVSAVRSNNAKIAGFLVDAGAEMDTALKRGGSALYEAAQIGHDPVVKLFIEKGPALNFKSGKNRWTPLLAALAGNHFSTASMLIDAGSDINTQGKSGYTPLIMAAYNGNAPNVRLLCERGADVDIQNSDGWTALHFAVSYQYKAVVAILLRNNASVDITNEDGHTALRYAEKSRNEEIINMLKNPDPKLIALSEKNANPDSNATREERIEGATIQLVRSASPLRQFYSSIIFNSFEISDHLSKDYPDAAINCKQSIVDNLQKKNVYANISESQTPPYPKKTIIVDGVIEDMHMANTASRILFGPLAGSPFMDVRIKLTDAESNTVIHEKVISSNTNAWFAGVMMGNRDRSLSMGMGTIIGEYLHAILPAEP